MAHPFDPATLDWNLLRAFGAVMQHGSLTRAAARLGSSQPTLSRQIAALEAELGAPLFERAARRLVPTAAAQALAEPAQRMLAAAQACALAADGAAAGSLAGSVRITASEVVSSHVLPAILARLADRHPQVQIELVATDQLNNLLEHEADIAVRMVRPTQTALITRHIADWPLGLYVHRRLLPTVAGSAGTHGHGPGPGRQAKRQVVAIHPTPDLMGLRKVGFDQSTQLIDGFRRAGFALTRQDFAFRCDSQVVNLAAVCAGLGLGVVLQPLAARLPDLVRIAPEAELPLLPVWLTAHRSLRASARLRLVFDFLAEALADWGRCVEPPAQRPPLTSTTVPVT